MLNPAWGIEWPTYSYSSGLSPQEINLLLEFKPQLKQQLDSVGRAQRRRRSDAADRTLWWKRPRTKFSIYEGVQDGGLWAASARHQLNQFVRSRPLLLPLTTPGIQL